MAMDKVLCCLLWLSPRISVGDPALEVGSGPRATHQPIPDDDPLVTAGRQTFETRSNPESWKGSQSRWDKAGIGIQS